MGAAPRARKGVPIFCCAARRLRSRFAWVIPLPCACYPRTSPVRQGCMRTLLPHSTLPVFWLWQRGFCLEEKADVNSRVVGTGADDARVIAGWPKGSRERCSGAVRSLEVASLAPGQRRRAPLLLAPGPRPDRGSSFSGRRRQRGKHRTASTLSRFVQDGTTGRPALVGRQDNHT